MIRSCWATVLDSRLTLLHEMVLVMLGGAFGATVLDSPLVRCTMKMCYSLTRVKGEFVRVNSGLRTD